MELNLEQRFMIYRAQSLIKSNDQYNSILISALDRDLNQSPHFVDIYTYEWGDIINIPGFLVMTSEMVLEDRNGILKLVNVSIWTKEGNQSGAIMLTESEFALFYQEYIMPHVEPKITSWEQHFDDVV